MLRIDAHQHFWRLDRGDYGWMPQSGVLFQDWLPDSLAPLNAAAGISSTVAVQAAPTEAETDFLLGLADRPGSQIAGVVGWVDLEAPDARSRLERFAQHPKAVGVRPMLHDLSDPAWILRPAVRAALHHLSALDLTFEVLSFPGHLPYAFDALAQIPELTVVIDHLSKPRYDAEIDRPWQGWMTRFAAREKTAVKVSGMVTEVGRPWAVDSFARNVDFVLGEFDADRVMFGSDWPVCLEAAAHSEVVGLATELTRRLSPADQQSFWAGTAQKFYRLVG